MTCVEHSFIVPDLNIFKLGRPFIPRRVLSRVLGKKLGGVMRQAESMESRLRIASILLGLDWTGIGVILCVKLAVNSSAKPGGTGDRDTKDRTLAKRKG